MPLAAFAWALAVGLAALSAATSRAASEDAPAAVESVRAPAFAAEPRASIALVLPLESTSFARAADAVRAGFLAAATLAQTKVEVVAHGEGGVLEAFARAQGSGARVIVGPLLRDDLKTLAAAAPDLPPTIALNQLDDGTALPPGMYAFALSVEGDARQLARRARADGALSVVVIASEQPLQKRFASAFSGEWILAGGDAPATVAFDRAPEVLAQLKRTLARAPPDAALLALDATDAALVKPYLGSIAVYAGSQVYDRDARALRRDLDDVRFVDVPWLVDPDAAAFANLPRAQFPNATLERLYALGVDAFRIAQAFESGPSGRLEFDGATGHVWLDLARQFAREGRLVRFQAGEVVPVDAR